MSACGGAFGAASNEKMGGRGSGTESLDGSNAVLLLHFNVVIRRKLLINPVKSCPVTRMNFASDSVLVCDKAICWKQVPSPFSSSECCGAWLKSPLCWWLRE